MKSLSIYLLVLLPVSVLVPWAPLAGPINTNDVLPILGGAGASWLIVSRAGRDSVRPFPWSVLLALGIAMLGAHCIGHWESFGVGVGGRTLGRMLLYAAVGVGVTSFFQDREISLLGRVFTVVILSEAGIGVVAVLIGISGPLGLGVVDYPPGHFPADGWARAQGTFGGVLPAGEVFVNRANFYSAYLAIGLFVVADRFAKRPRFLFPAVSLILLGILASGSRMSLLAALVGLVVFMTFSGQIKTLIAGLGISLATLLAYEPVRQRFLNLTTDRFELWGHALRVTASAPWFGVGDGHYLSAARELSQQTSVIHSPHHSILYAAASYGLLVALGLVALYVAMIWYAFKERKEQPALLAMTVAFILHDMTNNLFFIPEVALSFWLAWAYFTKKGAARA